MKGGIVDHHDEVFVQHGAKLLFEPGIEDSGITGAIKKQRRGKPFMYQRSNQAGAWPSFATAQSVDFNTTWRPSPVALGGGREATLIDIDEGLPLCVKAIPALQIAAAFFFMAQAFGVTPSFFYG